MTKYGLDGNANILSQTQGTSTTSNKYVGNQLQQTTTPSGQILLYWYDDLGRQQCVTDSSGSRSNCNPSDQTPAPPHLINDYRYDPLDRLLSFRTFSGGGSSIDEADYVYDALNRLVQETELHPGFNGDRHVTQFSYLGQGGLETEEQQTSKNTGNALALKDFTYDVYGHRLAMTDTPFNNGVAGTPITYTYGYDVHGSVSQLLAPDGSTKASYGYTPYGQSDSTLSQGENADKTNPINSFRYSAKRVDSGSGTLDTGVRRLGPDVAHFLTPDFFFGSLSDLSLSIDPLTQNRYGLAGGNPISFKEWDGHMVLADGGGTAAPDPSGAIQSTTTTTRTPSQDSRPSQPQQSCNWNPTSWGTCLHQHAQDLKKISEVSSTVASVAGGIALGCALIGAVSAGTVVGGIAGGTCAGVAGGVAAVASVVSPGRAGKGRRSQRQQHRSCPICAGRHPRGGRGESRGSSCGGSRRRRERGRGTLALCPKGTAGRPSGRGGVGSWVYKEGGLMSSIEHVMYRHGYESGFEDVSRFAEGTGARDIKGYVDAALRYGTVTTAGGTTRVVYDIGRYIGTDMAGNAATGIQVYIRQGIIRTAFPVGI